MVSVLSVRKSASFLARQILQNEYLGKLNWKRKISGKKYRASFYLNDNPINPNTTSMNLNNTQNKVQ